MRRFAVLKLDYNNMRVTFTLPALFSFVLLVSCFEMQIYITRSKQGIDSDLEGPSQKSRGPENLVRGPGNSVVPPLH